MYVLLPLVCNACGRLKKLLDLLELDLQIVVNHRIYPGDRTWVFWITISAHTADPCLSPPECILCVISILFKQPHRERKEQILNMGPED